MDIPRLKDLVPQEFANDQRGLALFGGYWDIDRDITIVEPLWFLGGILRPAAGVTIKINGPMYAPVTQIFDLSQGGTIVGQPEIESVNPVWWGADPDHVENSSPAINAAIEFCNGTFKPAVQFVAGNYLCLDEVYKRHSFYMPDIRGIGGGNTGEPSGVQLDFRESSIGYDASGNPTAEPGRCIYIKGGSGTLVTGSIDRISVQCKANQIALQIADQGGVLVSNCIFHDGRDSVQMFNESPNGFTEWCKLVNCTFDNPTRNCVRLRANAGATDSFHGMEILDCWAQISSSVAPAAIEITPKCFWYNGTLRIRVFFNGNPPDYQDVLRVDPSCRDPEIDGYIKTESGYGKGRLASGRNVDFPGTVLALSGVTWGTMRPAHWMQTLGPEGGASNGATMKWLKEFSYGPRAITVDASGSWYTGLYCPGEIDCEIVVRANNYEWHVSGIARPHHMGGYGMFSKISSWNLIDSTGWGEPSFVVGTDNALYLKNPKYPAGAVNFFIWYRQRSITHIFGAFALMGR
jgi:hypothetical protein